jgi:hypothetical protein
MVNLDSMTPEPTTIRAKASINKFFFSISITPEPQKFPKHLHDSRTGKSKINGIVGIHYLASNCTIISDTLQTDIPIRLVRFLYITRCPHSRHRICSLGLIEFDAPQSIYQQESFPLTYLHIDNLSQRADEEEEKQRMPVQRFHPWVEECTPLYSFLKVEYTLLLTWPTFSMDEDVLNI